MQTFTTVITIELMNVALNPQQVQHIAGIPIQVAKYSDLHKYKTLEQVFEK